MQYVVQRLIIFLCFFLFTFGQSQEGERCRTPDRLPGICISLKNCPSLLELLQVSRPLPNHVVETLRLSHCGFQGKTPLVCCYQPPNGQVTPRPTPRPTPVTVPNVVTDVAEDVSRHRNLRLLPRSICGPPLQDRIIKGNQTALLDFPWMALIAYSTRSGIQYRCGGTVISEKYVLTAAHCLVQLPSNLQLAGVRLGEHDISKEIDCEIVDEYFRDEICAPPAQDYGIESTAVHPLYSKDRLQNDIGLIRISGRANFSLDSVRPICLPVGKEQSFTMEGKKLIVAGWGATDDDPYSNVLLKTEVPVVDLRTCGSIYNRTVPITSKQICAGGVTGDSCGGDSGGPLISFGDVNGRPRSMQFGIVSFGPRRCGTFGQPGVYTKVGSYMKWILDNMRP